MPRYKVTADCVSQFVEEYEVEADSAEQAREMVESGDAINPLRHDEDIDMTNIEATEIEDE